MDFEKLVQAAGDAIVVADREGKIVLWNRAAERSFGFTQGEALGRSLDLIIPCACRRCASASPSWRRKRSERRIFRR